jgi:hypothetical protein
LQELSFIQQEDIPNKFLSEMFREEFQSTQRAFVQDESFNLNERSDYYLYCFYNSLKFLKNGGYLAAITSNAWLGKTTDCSSKDSCSITFRFSTFSEAPPNTGFKILKSAQSLSH